MSLSAWRHCALCVGSDGVVCSRASRCAGSGAARGCFRRGRCVRGGRRGGLRKSFGTGGFCGRLVCFSFGLLLFVCGQPVVSIYLERKKLTSATPFGGDGNRRVPAPVLVQGLELLADLGLLADVEVGGGRVRLGARGAFAVRGLEGGGGGVDARVGDVGPSRGGGRLCACELVDAEVVHLFGFRVGCVDVRVERWCRTSR